MTRKSTPKGFRHIWGYKGVWKEKKLTPKKWEISFRATKGKKSKSYGSFKKGFGVKWRINAIQTAVKTNKGQYKTHMKGFKTLLKTFKKRKR